MNTEPKSPLPEGLFPLPQKADPGAVSEAGNGVPGDPSAALSVAAGGRVEGPSAECTRPPGTEQAVDDEWEETIKVPWGGYLRTVWALFWNALLHPRSTTEVDLLTGKVLDRY